MEKNNQLNIFINKEEFKDEKALKAYEIAFVNMKYCRENYKELFEGYNSLKAITFSSSLTFIEKISNSFTNIELLFGNENVLGNIQKLFEYQLFKITWLNDYFKQRVKPKETDFLYQKILEEKLKIFLSRRKSHVKLYLLSNENEDKYRIITGSANLSETALTGKQQELLFYSDKKEDYNYWLEYYNEEKINKFDQLDIKKIIESDKEDLVNYTPILQQIEVGDISIDEEKLDKEIIDENVVYEKNLKKIFEKADIDLKKYFKSDKKNKKIKILTQEQKQKLIEKITEPLKILKNKEEIKIIPTLWYNDIENKVFFEDKELILNYDIEKVKNDLNILMKVFESYSSNIFNGNIEDSREKLYIVLNYMLCSPFISIARYYANKNNIGLSANAYPLNLVLYGKSGSGKTWTVEFFQHFCFGKKYILSPTEMTEVKMRNLRLALKGFPIIIDDVSRERWNKYKSEVKTDDYNSKNVSPIIVTTNYQLGIETQYNKRTIRIDLDTSSGKERNLMRNTVAPLIDKLTGEFYKYYMSKITAIFPEFIERILDMEKNKLQQYDIIYLSSVVLKECFKELLGDNLPKYCKTFTTEYCLITVNDLFQKKEFIEKFKEMNYLFEINKEKNRMYLKIERKSEGQEYQSKFGEDIVVDFSNTQVNFNFENCKKYFNYSFTLDEENIFKKIMNFLKN